MTRTGFCGRADVGGELIAVTGVLPRAEEGAGAGTADALMVMVGGAGAPWDILGRLAFRGRLRVTKRKREVYGIGGSGVKCRCVYQYQWRA